MPRYHMKKEEREIKDKKVLNAVLKNGKYTTVSLCRGYEPYLVTLSYGFDQEKNALYFHTAKEGLKIEFIKGAGIFGVWFIAGAIHQLKLDHVLLWDDQEFTAVGNNCARRSSLLRLIDSDIAQFFSLFVNSVNEDDVVLKGSDKCAGLQKCRGTFDANLFDDFSGSKKRIWLESVIKRNRKQTNN